MKEAGNPAPLIKLHVDYLPSMNSQGCFTISDDTTVSFQ